LIGIVCGIDDDDDDAGQSEAKPEFVYEVIEKLLPTANYSPDRSQNRLLELYVPLCCSSMII